jgi:pyruvate/2-oxoglutarate dehydrogenase complex dihydrolipoamide dehydrogenase (E3) component
LAGGDCLNVGCVPSKALLRAAKAIKEVRRASEFGILLDSPPKVDFVAIMRRMRERRSVISPADGHKGTTAVGAHVFQGRGRFTSPNTIEVNGRTLTFRKAVIATGGRPIIPYYPGLKDAPFVTNEVLFNLHELPPRMIVLGSGVVALEMAQCFALFGSQVTVLQRSERLFQSVGGDVEAASLIQKELERDGVTFMSNATVTKVTTLREYARDTLPLMRLSVLSSESEYDLECECLLVATGRIPNVEDIGLEDANVEFQVGKGVIVNDLSQSVSNPNVYAVGDCVSGVPRLTHQSGEMAKQVVQNALFNDSWKLSDFVTPSVMYTEPEYATVGISSEEMAALEGLQVDVYRGGLEHNDRAILESDTSGFCKVICEAGTDKILGATIVAARAGEIINEVTLAIKHNIGLSGIGRNIHAYPTTGEALMGAGIQYINSRWKMLNEKP